jgi:membrane protein
MPWKRLLTQTVQEWIDDNVMQHAASVAFYTMFSLAPLLIIAVAIAGAVFGEAAAHGQLKAQMDHFIGSAGAETVEQVLKGAERPALGTIAGLIGLGVLLFAASGVFAQLKTAMDAVFDVPPDPDATWWSMVVDRFFSFTMVLGTGFLLLVSLIISAVLTAMVTWLGEVSGAAAFLVMIVNFVVGFLFTAALFGAIFHYVPAVRPPWREVWPGALLTAFLFSLGRIVLGWYFGAGTLGSAYGAAASLVIVLAWVYYSAQIMFLGAEFTQVYGSWRRSMGAAGGAPADNETALPPGDGRGAAVHVRPRTSVPAQAKTAAAPPLVGVATLLAITAMLTVLGFRQSR